MGCSSQLSKIAELPEGFLATEEDLRSMIKTAQKVVKACLPDNNFPPQLAFLSRTENGEKAIGTAIIDADFNDAKEKRAALQAIGAGIYQIGQTLLAATLCTEGWGVPDDGDERPPRDRPDKKECIIIVGGFIHKREGMLSMAFVRRDKNNLMHMDEEFSSPVEAVPFLLGHLFRGFAEAERSNRKKGMA